MPRALIVTYQWLPMFNVGVKHVANLCRYLPAAGWEPHILTKDWSDGPAPEDAFWGMSTQPLDASPSLKNAALIPVVRTPYAPRDNRFLRWQARLDAERSAHSPLSLDAWARRALRLAYPLYGHYPDMHRGWVEPAVEAGLAAVRQFGIGAVVSVCPPATSHIVGGEIARRAGIPWVVVFADLFAFYQGPGDGRSLRLRWENRTLAKRWLKGASRSACISPRMVEYVRETYGVSGDVVVVPFDPDERKVAPHRAPGAPLRIVHAGSIYPNDERPEMLFDALDSLLAVEPRSSDEITVELVGSRCEEWLNENLSGRRCAAIVRVVSRVSPAEAVRMQREADLLLTFNYQNPIARAAGGTLSYPCKMFEHWNAGRPTIAIGTDPGGFVGRLLAETKAGEVVEDVAELVAMLQRYLTELRESGTIAFRGDDAAIARYGAPEQAKRLGALLDTASAERFGSWQRARN
jgi:hypothetical protein